MESALAAKGAMVELCQLYNQWARIYFVDPLDRTTAHTWRDMKEALSVARK